MKTAKVTAVAWYLDCPECGEGIENDEGSLMWAEGVSWAKGSTAKCLSGHVVRLPKFLRGDGK